MRKNATLSNQDTVMEADLAEARAVRDTLRKQFADVEL